MNTRRKWLRKVAKALVRDVGLFEARRFLEWSHRVKVLKRHEANAMADGRAGNPLSMLPGQPPLRVANQPSLVIVRAEGAAAKGTPILFDDCGQGVDIEAVSEFLKKETGRTYSPFEVVELYEQWYTAKPTTPKYVKLGMMLNRALRMRRVTEELLECHLTKYRKQRFAIVMDRDQFEAMIANTTKEVVVVTFTPPNIACFDGIQMECSGHGRGSAPLNRADLERLMKTDWENIAIEAHEQHWVAWLVSGEEQSGPVMYPYPGYTLPKL